MYVFIIFAVHYELYPIPTSLTSGGVLNKVYVLKLMLSVFEEMIKDNMFIISMFTLRDFNQRERLSVMSVKYEKRPQCQQLPRIGFNFL